MDCSPPGSSVHGILQARILEWVAISFSRGASQPRDQMWDPCLHCRPALQADSLPTELWGKPNQLYSSKDKNFIPLTLFYTVSTEGWLLYRTVLFPVKPQDESATGVQNALPFVPPSRLPPHPTPLGWYRAPVWVSWARQRIPIGYTFLIKYYPHFYLFLYLFVYIIFALYPRSLRLL